MQHEFETWLSAFRAKHGRTPRALHIGNIANNAYANAKMLNANGLDCDVICYDYYHTMGCPEWEDADFVGQIDDQFKPDWTKVDLKGFERPKWFAQGRLDSCARYLIARNTGNHERADALWKLLGSENKTRSSNSKTELLLLARFSVSFPTLTRYLNILTWDPDFSSKLSTRLQRTFSTGSLLGSLSFIVAMIGCLALAFLLRATVIPFLKLRTLLTPGRSARERSFADATARVLRAYQAAFPNRKDQLSAHDLLPYSSIINLWRTLLGHYDIVQAYATDPIFPLLANKHPYVAFEHGTLRTFTVSDNAISRLTSIAYNQADHVFITNGDCLDFARQIGVTRFTPMLHPFDEARIRSTPRDSMGFREQFGVKHVFLCTLRHDWSIKGTDKYIRALPKITADLGNDFRLLMTKWGADLNASMELAKTLGVDHLIEWIEPLNKTALIRAHKSVDILFDQIALPHFGATAPEGIAAGVPVIMSYDPKSTEWIVSEPAPILSAWTIDEIAANVKTALDPQWLSEYRKRAAAWIDNHHNSSIIVARHLEVYRQLLPA